MRLNLHKNKRSNPGKPQSRNQIDLSFQYLNGRQKKKKKKLLWTEFRYNLAVPTMNIGLKDPTKKQVYQH